MSERRCLAFHFPFQFRVERIIADVHRKSKIKNAKDEAFRYIKKSMIRRYPILPDLLQIKQVRMKFEKNGKKEM